MQGLTAKEILSVWEAGQYQTPAERALSLLSTFCPETSPDELERMSVGRRDELLLTFRELLFGSRFTATTTCPHCRMLLDLGFSTAEVRTEMPDVQAEEFAVTVGEYEFNCRLPDSHDLLAVRHETNTHEITAVLFARCVRQTNGDEVDLASLPDEVSEAVVAEIARRDPQGDIQFDLVCPDCSHEWEAIFDIVTFAWNEISVWACRLLRQVHMLAAAYGWREAEILALSPFRRQMYLEMLGE